MGARRLMGTSAVFGGIGSTIAYTAEKITGVSDEKVKAFQRSAAPDYQKNATLIPLTESDSNGNFKYFNFSYTNPYDSMIRPVNAVFNAYANGTLNDKTADQIVFDALFYDKLTDTPGALTEFITPFVSESIGSEAVFDIAFRNGETRDGRTIYFNQDTALEKIDKSLGHLFTQLEPGANRSIRRVYKGITGTFTQFGQQLDAKTELGALLAGVRVEEAKPLNSMPFLITSYGKDKQNIRREFGRNVFRVDATPEQRLAGFKEYILDSFESQKVFYQVLQDMKTMGVSSRKVEDILEKRLRNKSEVEQLIDGEFKVPGFSEETFDDLVDRLKIEDPIQAAKVASEIRQSVRAMERLRRRLRRVDLDDSREEVDNKINSILFPTISRFRGDESPSGIATVQAVELPVPQGLDTPVNTNIINQSIGNVQNDLLRQIELQKLI